MKVSLPHVVVQVVHSMIPGTSFQIDHNIMVASVMQCTVSTAVQGQKSPEGRAVHHKQSGKCQIQLSTTLWSPKPSSLVYSTSQLTKLINMQNLIGSPI